jgi:hypothetical protein
VILSEKGYNLGIPAGKVKARFILIRCSMDYVEITCRLQPDSNISEVLIALLADLGFESFVEMKVKWRPYIPLPSFTDDIKQALDSPGIR